MVLSKVQTSKPKALPLQGKYPMELHFQPIFFLLVIYKCFTYHITLVPINKVQNYNNIYIETYTKIYNETLEGDRERQKDRDTDRQTAITQ